MSLSVGEYTAAIRTHCEELAEVSAGNLRAPVEGCPGWDVADLLRHLIEVHWFWSTIAAEQLQEPPGEERRSPPPEDGQLIEAFRAGAARLVQVLDSADQTTPVWTWAPAQHDIAFITRHQLQEAAVHHYDAARAAGRDIFLEPHLATDAVEEFLTFSLSSDADPAEPTRPDLGGSFDLFCEDTGVVFRLSAGSRPGTLSFARAAGPERHFIAAPAFSILLWLYGRIEIESSVPPELRDGFRRLSFTE